MLRRLIKRQQPSLCRQRQPLTGVLCVATRFVYQQQQQQQQRQSTGTGRSYTAPKSASAAIFGNLSLPSREIAALEFLVIRKHQEENGMEMTRTTTAPAAAAAASLYHDPAAASLLNVNYDDGIVYFSRFLIPASVNLRSLLKQQGEMNDQQLGGDDCDDDGDSVLQGNEDLLIQPPVLRSTMKWKIEALGKFLAVAKSQVVFSTALTTESTQRMAFPRALVRPLPTLQDLTRRTGKQDGEWRYPVASEQLTSPAYDVCVSKEFVANTKRRRTKAEGRNASSQTRKGSVLWHPTATLSHQLSSQLASFRDGPTDHHAGMSGEDWEWTCQLRISGLVWRDGFSVRDEWVSSPPARQDPHPPKPITGVQEENTAPYQHSGGLDASSSSSSVEEENSLKAQYNDVLFERRGAGNNDGIYTTTRKRAAFGDLVISDPVQLQTLTEFLERALAAEMGFMSVL